MSDPATPTGRLISDALYALSRAGIRHVVLRNHEGLPDVVGNDLDLLVEPGTRSRAERILTDAAERNGWRLINRAEFVPIALFLRHGPSGALLHVDLFEELLWRGFEILPTQPILDSATFVAPHWVPSVPSQRALTLLSGLLYGGTVRPKYQHPLHDLATRSPGDLSAALASSCGGRVADRLVRLLREQDWDGVSSLHHAVRRAIIRRSARTPWSTMKRLARETTRIFRRFGHPPGYMVALLGVDGSGKSTVARGLADRPGDAFHPLRRLQLHWRPPLHRPKAETSLPPVVDPHGAPPRSTPVSLAYFAYHWSRFVLGSWTCLRPTLFRNGFIVFDRYFLDMAVDPRRYRLRLSPRLIEWSNRGLRRPDLTIILDLPADVAASRKDEVDAVERSRQVNAYRRLGERLPAAVVIDAAQPVTDVIDTAREVIEDALAARYSVE